jgi:hypothetical protein
VRKACNDQCFSLSLLRVASLNKSSLRIGIGLPKPTFSAASYQRTRARLQSWTVAELSNTWSYPQAIERAVGVLSTGYPQGSFRTAPTFALEMDWIGCPNPHHWNRAPITIGIAIHIIFHRSLDCFHIAAYFAAIVILRHYLASAR